MNPPGQPPADEVTLDDVRRQFGDRWDIAKITAGYKATTANPAAGPSPATAAPPPNWSKASAPWKTPRDRLAAAPAMTHPSLASDAAPDAAIRHLGTRLAAIRKNAGHSQTSLARHIGYSRTTISDAEHGRGRQAAPFWAGCDTTLATRGQPTAEYQRITARRTQIRTTRAAERAATRAAERATGRQAATRSTIAAILAHTTTGQPAPAIIIWNDGTTTTAHPGPGT